MPALSFAFFFIVNKYAMGRQKVTKKVKEDKDTNRLSWLWHNTFCSLLHSTISSLWVLLW